jgi:hypothetical protein
MVAAGNFLPDKIYVLRGQKVKPDFDLARLYSVETKALKQAFKRAPLRFPADFMVELSTEKLQILRSQFVTSSWGGTRKLPFVFTEQGIAMLSGVLHSDAAIAVNIQIMRVFVRLRQMLIGNASCVWP